MYSVKMPLKSPRHGLFNKSCDASLRSWMQGIGGREDAEAKAKADTDILSDTLSDK